jgi:hypothetical protein
MHMTLLHRLRRLGRRSLGIGLAAALGWMLVVAAAVLAAGVWLDLLWDTPPSARLAVVGLAILAAATWFGFAAARAWRGAAPAALARRLDDAAGSGGQVLSGVDLASAPAGRPALTAGLAELAVERAGAVAGCVSGAAVAPVRPVMRAFGAVALVAVGVAAFGLGMPRLFWTQWARFTDPLGEHAPFSRLQIHVEPGDVAVIYGGSVDIQASVEGGSVERLDLVLTGAQPGDNVLPMFPDSAGGWRATVAHVAAPIHYFVRAHAGRSARHKIGVITAPQLRSVHFHVTPPAYTNRPSWEGPLPQGGLAVLRGTTVELWARSNRPLGGGILQFHAGQQVHTRELTPTSPEAAEVAGAFEVQGAGKITVQVTDVDGQSSTEPFSAPVTIVNDERPEVRLLEPAQLSFATPSAVLPVQLVAEDDYGLARLQLFRSLNDSRGLPQEIKLSTPARLRWTTTVTAPLAAYGLAPGDEIKLFARAEDTDPDGPNGADSNVATVKIISEEEYQRLMLAQQTIEHFIAIYRQAQRRTAKLADEVEGLRKKAKDLSADDAKQALAELTKRIGEERDALRKLTERPLPFDLDAELKRLLRDSTDRLARLEDRVRALAKSGYTPQELAELLRQMERDLDQQQGELEREAVDPLERLAAALPLLEDAARFVILVRQQKALAERLRFLDGQERPEDAAVVRRFSEGKLQQTALRERLLRLLDEIEDHAAALPELDEYQQLRKDAEDFVKAARGIGAVEAMLEAEKVLGELAGTRAHVAARQAADRLAALLEKSDDFTGGLGDGGAWVARFAPSLSRRLGQTLSQMLAQKGLLPGQQGGAQGTAAQGDSVGLYGGNLHELDDVGQTAASQGAKNSPGGGAAAQQSKRVLPRPGANPAPIRRRCPPPAQRAKPGSPFPIADVSPTISGASPRKPFGE